MPPRIPYRFWIALILAFAYSVQWLVRVGLTVLAPRISADVGLSTADLGTGMFWLLVCYGPAQLISGSLTDRLGAKRILVFSVVAWSLMTAWLGRVTSPGEYFVRMALFGLMAGTEYVPSARILMRWFNKQGRARAQALLSLAWILTPAWGSVLVTQLALGLDGWRPVFDLISVVAIVPLALIALLIFDRPEHYRRITRGELEYSYQDEIAAGLLPDGDFSRAAQQIAAHKPFAFRDLFASRSYLAVVLVVIVIQIAYWGSLVWVPLYLSDAFGFKLATMGWWNGLYFASAATGSVVSSYLSDRLFGNNRRVMIVVCFAGLIPFVLLLASLRTADPGLLALALCGMGFFANMGWGPVLAVPAEIFSPEVYGKAMGLVNCCGYVAAAFATKLFSALVVVTDTGKDYTGGWVLIAVCALTGIVAAAFVRTAPAPAAQGTAAR